MTALRPKRGKNSKSMNCSSNLLNSEEIVSSTVLLSEEKDLLIDNKRNDSEIKKVLELKPNKGLRKKRFLFSINNSFESISSLS